MDNVKKEGHLFKLGQLNKQWKLRFFVLKDDTLYYFKNVDENTGSLSSSRKSVVLTPGNNLSISSSNFCFLFMNVSWYD